MKSIKYILICGILALSVMGGGLYSSCTKDACKGTTCIHGGTCSGGMCTCTKPGTGGVNCEIVYRDFYTNFYKGSGHDDSVRAFIDNTFTFTAGADTNYTLMTVAWNHHGPHIVNMPITLKTFTSTESTFTVSQTTVDSLIYTGYGIVSSTSASMTLSEWHPDSTTRTITLNNFVKQ